jgi:hypothetical protein
MHADSVRLNDLPGRVIGRAFTVLNTIGVEFLEKVALAHEVRAAGLAVSNAWSTACEPCRIIRVFCVDPR